MKTVPVPNWLGRFSFQYGGSDDGSKVEIVLAISYSISTQFLGLSVAAAPVIGDTNLFRFTAMLTHRPPLRQFIAERTLS